MLEHDLMTAKHRNAPTLAACAKLDQDDKDVGKLTRGIAGHAVYARITRPERTASKSAWGDEWGWEGRGCRRGLTTYMEKLQGSTELSQDEGDVAVGERAVDQTGQGYGCQRYAIRE
jgi:hypothetical protein